MHGDRPCVLKGSKDWDVAYRDAMLLHSSKFNHIQVSEPILKYELIPYQFWFHKKDDAIK